MDEFLAYVDALSPGFVRGFRGCRSTDIWEYAELVGQPLPRFYRSYLATIGESDGGLMVFADAKTSAAELSDFYRLSVVTGECRFPPETFAVAVRGWTLYEACMSLASAEDGPLYTNRDDVIELRYADTLRTLLFRKAFVALCMNAYHISGSYLARGPDYRLNCVRERLSGSDMQLEWFSDSVAVAARNDEVAVYARQFAVGPCWVRIAGPSRKVVSEVAAKLCAPCGLKLDVWLGSDGSGGVTILR